MVDDTPANVELITTMLKLSGYTNVSSTTEPSEVLNLVRFLSPDLVILDMHMPQKSGIEVLKELRADPSVNRFLPVLAFTADSTQEMKMQALAAGASDFLQKPGDLAEILLRVDNFLELRWLHRQVEEHNQLLEMKVQERTADLEESRRELLHKLALVGEYNDDATGRHTSRVSELSAKIARNLGLEPSFVEEIRLASILHDIGKVAIPDSLLLKPDRLTKDEYQLMQSHALIGANILSNSGSPMLQVAERIARWHHERWDGQGYPDKLVGSAIPIEARIVAVADVYDALTNERPYKPAWTRSEALQEIKENAGTQFDPAVVQSLRCVLDQEERNASRAA